MSAELENELHLRSYLLGYSTSDEQQLLEQHLMTDAAAFEELLRTEEELIDSYLEGTLSEDENEKFETFFLSAPERQQQLAFARALKRYIAEHRPKKNSRFPWRISWLASAYPRNSMLKWALAASLLLLIVGGAWSILQITQLRRALDRAESGGSHKQLMELQKQNADLALALQQEQAHLKTLESAAANQSIPPLRQGQSQPTLIVMTLSPGLLRDMGGLQKMQIPSGTHLVQIDLKMEPEVYPRYEATLRRVDEDRLWTQISPGASSSTDNPFFRLLVPANMLQPGDFVLKLRGIPAAGEIEDLASYYFRILP